MERVINRTEKEYLKLELVAKSLRLIVPTMQNILWKMFTSILGKIGCGQPYADTDIWSAKFCAQEIGRT